MTVTLKVEPREERGKKVQKLRTAGKLPAVVYGPKQEATPIMLDRVMFEKVLRDAGESTIMKLEGLDEEAEVLVHEVSFDPTKGGAIHVDFYAFERGKELTVNVPLEFIGEAPAVKQGGTLTKVLYEVEVTCRPSALPHELTVDVSPLDDFEKTILVKDIPIPDGVKIENDPEETVVLVQEVEEEPEEEPAEVDMDAIEVEAKGKEADGSEDEAEEEGSKE